MALDSIDKVREAEKSAEEAEKAAGTEAERIVAKAVDDAAEIKVELTRKSREKVDAMLKDACEKGDSLMADATLEAGKAVEILRSSVSTKEEDAIKFILNALI